MSSASSAEDFEEYAESEEEMTEEVPDDVREESPDQHYVPPGKQTYADYPQKVLTRTLLIMATKLHDHFTHTSTEHLAQLVDACSEKLLGYTS